MKSLLKISTKILLGIILIIALTVTFNAAPVKAESCWAVVQEGETTESSSCILQEEFKCGGNFKEVLGPPPVCACTCVSTGQITPTPVPTNVPSTSPTKTPGVSGTPGGNTGGSGGTGGTSDCGVDSDWLTGFGACGLRSWAGTGLKYMIAIGFVYAVAMTPYIMILFAKGGPNDIKHAWELINSILYGLILLVFAATVVTITGGSILQI